MIMKNTYTMGIDVGTNETKGVLIDHACNVIAFANRSHSIENPKPNYFEMDCEIWYQEVCEISKELLAKSGVDKAAVTTLGTSVMGCDCIAVDEQCKPLMKAILYGVDCRSYEEIQYLNDFYGDQAEAVFRHEICSSDIAPKILWIQKHRPDVFEKAYKFLTGSSYLSAKLTGRYVIDQYLAEDFFPLYDIDKGEIVEVKEPFFCHREQLAELATAMDIIGTLNEQAASDMGLTVQTQVLCGTGDSGAEAVSTGVFTAGDLMVQLGSSCYFVYLCDHLAKNTGLWPGTFIIPGTYSILAGTNTAGTLTKWFRDTMYFDKYAQEREGGLNAYSAMTEDIADVPAGSNGLISLPYFAGERTPINDPLAKGMIIGLNVSHTRGDMLKSALEGIAYSIAQHIDILEGQGLPLKKIMLVGGGTKNPHWMQIIADVLQKDVCTCKVSFGAAYGDALMAMIAEGSYAGWEELEEVVKPDQIIHPNPANREIYAKGKKLFKELYQINKDIMHQL